MGIQTAVWRSPTWGTHFKPLQQKPSGEIKLLAMLSVGVNSHFFDRFSPQKVHGIEGSLPVPRLLARSRQTIPFASKSVHEAVAAVAHAGKYSKSDPDDAKEVDRLHVAADIMRSLARHFISKEFGVSESQYSGD